MAINKKLIHFKSKSSFETELANNNILDTSIVFIKDTKEIWTHGTLYDCSGGVAPDLSNYVTDDELSELLSPIQTELSTKITSAALNGYAKTSDIPTTTSQLTNDSGYITGTEADKAYAPNSLVETVNNQATTISTLATKSELNTGLSGKVDKATLDNYVPTTRKVNGVALTKDIVITAADLDAATKEEFDNLVTTVSGKVDTNTLSNYATTTALSEGLAGKQATLVSGKNIKTIEGQSILGSGDIQITATQVGSYTTKEVDDKVTAINNSISTKFTIPTTKTLAGFGITDGVNAISSSGSGSFITGISIDTTDKHKLNVTKGNVDLSGYATTSSVNNINTDLQSFKSTVSNTYITPAGVDTKIAALVDSSPEKLDTLNELAAALGDDPNFATTVTGLIGNKADKTALDNTNTRVSTIESDYKKLQTAVTSPSASTTTSTTFIDTVSQNEQGVITATKKTLPTASTSVVGIVKLTDSTSNTSTTTAATPNSVKKAYDLANTANTTVNTLSSTVATKADKTELEPLANAIATNTVNIEDLMSKKTYWDDVEAKPTIPTKVSELTNDSGYTKNTGTVISVATGVGLTGGTITGSGTIKAKLKSETASTLDSAAMGSTANRQYAVGVDKSGYLSVNVPWTDNNTTYSFSNNNPTLAWGTKSTVGTVGGVALTVTMPANPNTDTHYTTNIRAGASGTNSNAATSNPYVKVLDNTTYRSQIQLKGDGATTVSSDANGVITISSTDTNTNTTYSAGSGISLSGTTFSHADTSTLSGSYGPTANVSGSNGATINVPQITVDGYGHVTGVTNRTYTSVNTTYSVATQSANGLMSATDKKLFDYATGMNTATSVASVPITKGSCKCTISAAGSFSLASTPAAGRTIHVLIYNSASSAVTVTLPNSGSYVSFSGTSLSVPATGYAEISVFSDGSKMFIRAGR